MSMSRVLETGFHFEGEILFQLLIESCPVKNDLISTSWLPRRPGLGALATLIFSPRAEMRSKSEHVFRVFSFLEIFCAGQTSRGAGSLVR